MYGLQPNCEIDDPTRFNICLDITSNNETLATWMEGFGEARDRWEAIIVGDDGLEPVNLTSSLEADEIGTGLPLNGVDDLYISAGEESIDGLGGVLGFAGPTAMKVFFDRENFGFFDQPFAGILRFDTDDILRMERDGIWTEFLIHEMGHVLGFGTLFEINFLYGGLPSDRYAGFAGNREWDALGCSGTLPIETDGGEGTAGSHWDETCLDDEVMTGVLVGREAVLSRLTIAAMEDLRYTVSYDTADDYTIDDLSESCSVAYCPERQNVSGVRRRRSLADSGMPPKKAPMTPEGLQLALEAGQNYLRTHRRENALTNVEEEQLLEEAASSSEETVEISVEADFVIVLIQDTDDQIKDYKVTWQDVLAADERLANGVVDGGEENIFDHI